MFEMGNTKVIAAVYGPHEVHTDTELFQVFSLNLFYQGPSSSCPAHVVTYHIWTLIFHRDVEIHFYFWELGFAYDNFICNMQNNIKLLQVKI
jgi:hypothetical protein